MESNSRNRYLIIQKKLYSFHRVKKSFFSQLAAGSYRKLSKLVSEKKKLPQTTTTKLYKINNIVNV